MAMAAPPPLVNAPSKTTLEALLTSYPAFFNEEANVNSIWNGFFAEHFHYTYPLTTGNSYLLAPEGQAPDGKAAYRADILISLIRWQDDGSFGDIIPVLSFEGKSGKSSDKYTQIGTQMDTWFKNSAYAKMNLKVYGVGARGVECWFFYNDSTSSEIRRLNIRDNGSPWLLGDKNVHLTYNIVTHFSTIMKGLKWISEHPGKVPPSA
ncbi:hypothetical protein BDZ45DRAFT_750195 [Acephala macrosclerotiorum]|nr:hypothetical protein BDZ45DRAFT_750195 [Acephala macrosclerotiorum]